MKNLYSDESIKLMKAAESCGFSENRIEQIRSFALAAGFRRIGIANCIVFSSETETIKNYLSKEFDVFSADCKYGSLRRSELFGGNAGSSLCNPAGQADFLNSRKTELNISIGLCVGHDMIFSRNSHAPVTTLFTKDFTNGNNPAKAVKDIAVK